MASFFRRTVPSAALLVLGLVALLVIGIGGVAFAGGSGGSWSGGAAGAASSWSGGTASGATNAAGATVVAQVGSQVMFDSAVNATVQLPSGQTTFDVSTPDAAGHTVLLVQLSDGMSTAQFLADLQQLSSGSSSGRSATNAIDNLGGALVNSQCSVTFTENLTPGTYELIDFYGSGISDQHPKVQQIQVAGAAGPAVAATVDQRIMLTDAGGRPRFVTPTTLPADGTFEIDNESSNTNESAFISLKPGTTAAALRKYFAGFGSAGSSWQSSPFAGAPCGLAPINPGHQVVVHISTRPGQYVLASFALDAKTNKREAQLGMYQQVDFATAP